MLVRRLCVDDNGRLVEETPTVHVNTNYVIKSDDGAYIYVRYASYMP